MARTGNPMPPKEKSFVARLRYPFRLIPKDPRLYQITVLGSLLTYGVGWLDFEVQAAQAGLILSTALMAQYVCTRIWRLPAYDPRSPLISGLSLCLLLRTNAPGLAVAAAL